MSNFDLHLDRWSKIFTILIGALGLVATTYVSVWVIIPAHERDNKKVCADYKLDAKQALKQSPDDDMAGYVEQITEFCSENQDQALAYVSGEAADAQILEREEKRTEQEITARTIQTSGYVSLGRKTDFENSNFTHLGTMEKAVKVAEGLDQGEIVQARGSVNLRENNTDTEAGNNKPILTIKIDDCVKLEEKPELLRGSYWVKVQLLQCP